MGGYFEYRHTVAFAETDLSGVADYVNYLVWQGQCREQFLRQRMREALTGEADRPSLFTLKVDCDLLADVTALDRLSIRMRVLEVRATQIDLAFDYVKVTDLGEMLVAHGSQRIACISGPRHAPAPVPDALADALAPYADSVRPLAGRQS
ncbi:acyl-CoA thioesterase [Streptomyces cahuitamycinicus]|uniref:4-hydroxybenzoyl-CoA thioesterase n=1 Tax=Streptomyces cahuitamycinicus TaxID=2070367 RepID=A0A2N8TWX1_9ACTN|nr:thioesterase family protein [Streptomyces cahuitamycinicus]PNG23516.1 4-hydroxybenzoyl-CoA thioesterase [Streptomyces cahuitamycinicus]